MRDRIAAVSAGINRLASRRTESRRARDYHDRAEALRKPAERLAVLCSQYRLLAKHGVGVQLPADQALSLLGQLSQLREGFKAEPESILTADPTRAATFWKPLEGYAHQVESGLKQGWQNWVASVLPGGEQELLAVLDRFSSFREPVQVIRNCLTEVEVIVADLPSSDSTFDAMRVVADRMSKAWDRLNGAHVSPAVLSFLRKAAAREATLVDYTPEVMRWIEEHRLLGSFLVTVGGM